MCLGVHIVSCSCPTQVAMSIFLRIVESLAKRLGLDNPQVACNHINALQPKHMPSTANETMKIQTLNFKKLLEQNHVGACVLLSISLTDQHPI